MTVAPPLSASFITIVSSCDSVCKADLCEDGMLLLAFEVGSISVRLVSDEINNDK